MGTLRVAVHSKFRGFANKKIPTMKLKKRVSWTPAILTKMGVVILNVGP